MKIKKDLNPGDVIIHVEEKDYKAFVKNFYGIYTDAEMHEEYFPEIFKILPKRDSLGRLQTVYNGALFMEEVKKQLKNYT